MKPKLFDGFGHVLSIAYESKQTMKITWRCASRKSKSECKAIVYESASGEFTQHKRHNCNAKLTIEFQYALNTKVKKVCFKIKIKMELKTKSQ